MLFRSEGYDPDADGDLYDKIFGGDEQSDDSEKPFGDEEITEDEATAEASKEG